MVELENCEKNTDYSLNETVSDFQLELEDFFFTMDKPECLMINNELYDTKAFDKAYQCAINLKINEIKEYLDLIELHIKHNQNNDKFNKILKELHFKIKTSPKVRLRFLNYNLKKIK